MADKGIPIAISVKVLEEYFQCSICLNNMNEVVVTSCGHRYCDKCIREWVDRHHNCPCCNGTLSTTQLIKDHQFQGLMEACKKEKELAQSNYFEHLINTVSGSKPGTETKMINPVEEVLKKHLTTSLAAHELYFEDLRQQFHLKAQQLEMNMQAQLGQIQMNKLSPDTVSKQIEELQQNMIEKKSAMEMDMQECQKLVAEAFDRYLSEHIPSLEILPVTVTLVLADKGIRIPNVTLKPDDVLTEIQTAVEEGLIQKGDRVIRWQPDGGKVLLVSPLSKQTSYNVNEILESINCGRDTYPGIHLLSWLTKPVLQHHMKPGSELVLHGCIVCESDLPKMCYAEKHKKEGPSMVDYFQCNQCHFKWICRSCIQVCHKDHDVSPFVFDHQPTWACCYCPKKKTCCLQTC